MPEPLKKKFNTLFETAKFIDWTSLEYKNFIKAFRKLELGDISGIQAAVATKTVDQVKSYVEVFLTRFPELKERDIVVMKLEQRTFEDKI